MTEYEKLLKRFQEWLPGEPNDFADLTSLRAFCSLFTAKCLDATSDSRQMLYRRRVRHALFELEPAERILLDCAWRFFNVSELVTAAAKKIRQKMPETRRTLVPDDVGKFAEIQAGISEALAYEPPVSSCSV